MSEHKRLDYLDLSLNFNSRNIISLDKAKHICYFRDLNHKHMLHGEDFQLNTVTDLLVSLGSSLETHQERFYRIIEHIHGSISSRNEKLKEYNQNLKYLKESQELLTKAFDKLHLEDLPSKQDLKRLSDTLDFNKPKDIELESRRILEQVKKAQEANKQEFHAQIQIIHQILEEIRTA